MLFIVETPVGGSPLLNAFGISDLAKYAYDLNNWLIKYGKTQEFLIAVHTATMAPDFTYKLATSPAVDTKVHVSLFDTTFVLTIVTAEKSDESVLGLLEGADTDTAVVEALQEKIEEIIENIDSTADIPSSLEWVKGKISSYYNPGLFTILTGEPEKPFYDIPTKVEGTEYTDAYITKLYIKVCKRLMKEKLASLTSVTEILGESYFSKIISEVSGLTLSQLGITDEKYSILGSLPIGAFEEAKKAITNLEATATVATPYITKVVKHWYRNQYFTDVGGDTLDSLRQAVKNLIFNCYNIIYDYRLEEQGTEGDQTFSDVIALISSKQSSVGSMSKESLISYVADFKAEMLAKDLTDEKREKIENEFSAMQTMFDNEEFTGGAYSIQANPAPAWKKMSEINEKSGGKENPSEGAILKGLDSNNVSEAVQQFILSLAVKETRTADIIQIHNPLFEDNSQYIRNWLKQKYLIYAGKTEITSDDANKERTSKATKTEKYIQGKSALQAIEAEMEECKDVRADMIYMLRDLKELFQDFEFDLENVEAPASKVLDNIMPAYKPYTPWPSIYEKSEGNSTKMIYKGGSTELVAPENCCVRNVDSSKGIIDLEFKGDLSETAGIMQMTMRVKVETGSLSPNVSKGSEPNKGDTIATVSPSDGLIVLKLNLFTATKQLARVEDYMNVDDVKYNDLSSSEKGLLLKLIEYEVEEKDTPLTFNQANALVNVVLNRIASPLSAYKGEKTITNVIGNAEHAKEIGFENYSKHVNDEIAISSYESKKYYKSAITNALMGIDKTKDDTLLGATRYYIVENEDDFDKVEKDLKTYVRYSKRVFGISNDDYYEYLKDLVEKKIFEVVYELDISKYLEGIEEGDGGYDTSKALFEHQEAIFNLFKDAIDEIVSYYNSGRFIADCGGIKFVDPNTTVSSLVKSNVYQEIEESNGSTSQVTDHFTLTANANYIVKWTFTYEVGKEGKITSTDVKVESEAVQNY